MEIAELKKLTEQGERDFLKSEVKIKDLPSFIWIDSFLSLAGSILYEREDNRKPNDIDIIVRAQEKDGKFWVVLDPALRLKIDRILEKRFGNKSVEWMGSTYGPNWRALPLYDLALIPRKKQEIIEMNEPKFAEEFYKAKEMEKKLSDKQKEEYDKETAIINENKKKPQAEKIHEFKAAKYTHPNGHPRCLVCGDEEPVGGVCNMPDSWYQKHEFDDEEAWEEERKILREKGIIKQGMDWVNSPTFAYQAVYGKLPYKPLSGRSGSPKRMWNDKEVDKEFKDKWLEDLNNIPDIEIRATDIGHSIERVAFVVFRMKDPKNDCKVKAISDELNKIEGLYSKYDTGQEDRLRIVVAGKIKLEDKNWEEWWNSLAGKIGNVTREEFEKLDLEQFRAEGIDDDLKNPLVRHKELFADLRYLGNSGYPKLKEGKKWGEWKLEDIIKYYAAVVDALRSVYFPITSPKIGDEEYKTSYWECYRESRKYMKSKPPAEKDIKEWDNKRKGIIKDGQEIAKFTFKKIDEAEYIVGGVVYFSYKQDSQEDWTTPPEVWKALKRFMLKKKKLKVMHEGKEREIPIIENYFVEEQHHKGGMSTNNLLEKGDWWLAVYLGDEENKDIWGRVLKKELTGFSMAGRASSPS